MTVTNTGQIWKAALHAYRYKANLTKFKDAGRFPGWFKLKIDPGDRVQTTAFETNFRGLAQHNIEAWCEVTFWKYYTMGQARDRRTRDFEERTKGVSAVKLYNLCISYIQAQTSQEARETFDKFRGSFVEGAGVAWASTFPAFLAPDRFPMIDSNVANWVLRFHQNHNVIRCGCPKLVPPRPNGTGRAAQPEIRDWNFIWSWIKWCRDKAETLQQVEPLDPPWRARDVEMAVFEMERSHSRDLPPLCKCSAGPAPDLPDSFSISARLDFTRIRVSLPADVGIRLENGWLRAKVPEGWIVVTPFEEAIFVPDHQHRWE